jgi:hypothetical protein
MPRNAPLLVPLFPRPSIPGEAENLYLQALSRPALETKQATWAREIMAAPRRWP